MIICLDVGNTHIYGGVFKNDQIVLRFRYDTKSSHTSDQIGLFFTQVLRENGFDANKVEHVVVSSVVPSIDYSLRSACIKYLKHEPLCLAAGIKTGIKIKTQNPKEVGADIIASCIAAHHSHPDKNIIVADFGTATTISAITKDGTYHGTTILPGFKTMMSALQSNAAKLPAVEIVKPKRCLGNTTVNAIQAGLYYSQLSALKTLSADIAADIFNSEACIVIGTGGFSKLFKDEDIFDEIQGDLVLEGLHIVLKKNTDNTNHREEL